MNKKKRVAVALSGGVDSAVAAALLLEQGYDVIGITGQMTCSEDSNQIIDSAKNVANKLGIEHYVINVSEEFSKKVINYFEDSYRCGKTPNPCIMCNKYIKWGAIFDYAIGALKCDFIATGHYAQIKHEDKYYKLFPAFDTLKDQLYFLFLLTQEHLAKTFFPLSNLKKAEVKEIAEKYDLPSKSAKESQDICFIKPPITTKKYLNRIFKEQQGNFIDVSTGKIIGQHNGYWQYTIGQRKGIGIAAPQPLYVIKIEPENNQVFVGDKDTLLINKLTLKNINWSYPQYQKRFKALVKIRYNMPAIESIIEENNGYWEITFNTPVSGIAQGQACVLYDLNDGHLLGGDFI